MMDAPRGRSALGEAFNRTSGSQQYPYPPQSSTGIGRGVLILFFSLPVSVGAGIMAAIALHNRMNGDVAMNPLFLLGGIIAGIIWCFTPFAQQNRLGHFILTFIGIAVLGTFASH